MKYRLGLLLSGGGARCLAQVRAQVHCAFACCLLLSTSWLLAASGALLGQSPELSSALHESSKEGVSTPDSEQEDAANQDVTSGVQSGFSEPPASFTEEIRVRERADDMVGLAVSASEGSTGYRDLQLRPILRPGDVVETVPGMVATQHSGGGKANQLYVRGFNLDHGTDFAISVAGVPVNMPTHGHGQGYADLNFLIPEIVERARFRKGPYWAEVGDFSSAGSLDIDLLRKMPARQITLTGGNYAYGRALFADSFELGRTADDPSSGGDLLVAVEGFHEDGPWTRGDDYDGGKAVLRWSTGDANRGLSLTAMGYDANWLATDQIPQRAVDSGLIDRFDFIAPGPRGKTRRSTLSVEGLRRQGSVTDSFSLYAMSYDFLLVGDFTYFLEDPERGDEVTQLDDRLTLGGEIERSWYRELSGRAVEVKTGAQMRFDQIDNGLLLSENAIPFATARSDQIDLFGGGLFAQAQAQVTDWLRAILGLRYQLYAGDVTSDLEVNSGRIDDSLLSPKIGFAFGPWNRTEIYFDYGQGMHSNDARGAVLRVDPLTGEPAEASDPLVRTEGFELGVRTTAIDRVQSTLTLFRLDLDSELIFVGDAGITEAGRPSRRTGIEWANYYRLTDALSLELDATFTDAVFRDEDPSNQVPGAVGTTIASGLTWDGVGPWNGALRWRYFGDIPLVEDGSVEWRSSSALNARCGYRFSSGLELTLDVFNLLDRQQSDVEYYYASRLPGEPSGGVDDIHFHPAAPRSARLSLTWRPGT